MDRPATVFGEAGSQWGVVGEASPMRGLLGRMAEAPVRLISPRRGPGMVELVYGHLSTNEYKAAIADLPDLNRGSTVSLQEGPAGGA